MGFADWNALICKHITAYISYYNNIYKFTSFILYEKINE
uniref:Uncharacterized protein n=1 Tax=Manihot esculenta TaxID=3983 RepID=A0A2C9UBN3_MANES